MKKILYTTTAFILCGIAQSQAACIPTPSCTSLGYTSTTSCTDGLKCPFGNYWNCDLNKITELTNKITELETLISNSYSLCSSCVVGDYICGGKCFPETILDGKILSSGCTGFVVSKENGVCKQISVPITDTEILTLDKFIKEAIITDNGDGSGTAVLTTSEIDHAIENIGNSYSLVREISVVGYNGGSGYVINANISQYGGYSYSVNFNSSCDGTDFKACLSSILNFSNIPIPKASSF